MKTLLFIFFKLSLNKEFKIAALSEIEDIKIKSNNATNMVKHWMKNFMKILNQFLILQLQAGVVRKEEAIIASD